MNDDGESVRCWVGLFDDGSGVRSLIAVDGESVAEVGSTVDGESVGKNVGGAETGVRGGSAVGSTVDGASDGKIVGDAVTGALEGAALTDGWLGSDVLGKSVG